MEGILWYCQEGGQSHLGQVDTTLACKWKMRQCEKRAIGMIYTVESSYANYFKGHCVDRIELLAAW